jgi:hypothetical protein
MGSLPHILSYYDIILTPIYFLLLLLWVKRWKKKHYQHSPLKKYIIPAFVLKVVCCILLALLYEFYYGYSDAHNYYTGTVEIWNATKANPVYGLELVFKPFEKCSPAAQEFGSYMSNPVFSTGIVNMFKTSGFIGMFCFGTYLPIALVITLLCFIGSWKIFIVFVEEFPEHYKKIALTCLFAPSFVFWGTNIMKDPLVIFGLGLSVSALYNLMKGRFSFLILLELLAGSFIMLSFKSYVFYLFVVAGFGSIYINFVTSSTIKFKMLIRLVLLVMLISAVTFAIIKRDYLTEVFTTGFMNEVTTIQNVQKDQGGAVYVLPNVADDSFFGIIKTYLRSLNVALFRPYLWEVPNLIAIANALESFVVLFFSVYLLIQLKITGFFKFAFQNRVLTFALIFTLLLAPLAGLVSFNFGTLVRYKAPLVPFYYTYLMLLFLRAKERKNAKKKVIVA